MAGLFLSGVTAFPLQTELRWLLSILETPPVRRIAEATHLLPWIARVHHALSETNTQYPFLAYGRTGHVRWQGLSLVGGLAHWCLEHFSSLVSVQASSLVIWLLTVIRKADTSRSRYVRTGLSR